MYGARYRHAFSNEEKLDSQLQSIHAARTLMQNLESSDIIDLMSTVAMFHDMMTEDEEEKLHFQTTPLNCNYSEMERRRVQVHNYNVLHHYYLEPEYQDPDIAPVTIQQLLIKVQWLSFLELPIKDCVEIRQELDFEPADYLNWETVKEWMANVWRNTLLEPQGS